MKKTTVLIILLAIVSSINGFEFCGIKKGLYVDVKTSVYEMYRPIETLTNGYIQIDSNSDYFEPAWAVVNAQEVSKCTADMMQNENLICD